MKFLKRRSLPPKLARELDAEIVRAGPSDHSQAIAEEIAMRIVQLNADLENLITDRDETAKSLANIESAITIVEITISHLQKLSEELDNRIENNDENIIKVEKIASKFANGSESQDEASDISKLAPQT